MDEKYNMVAQQNLIRPELLWLHLSKTMGAKSCPTNEALAKVRDRSTTFKPQVLDTERSEEEIKFLQSEMSSTVAERNVQAVRSMNSHVLLIKLTNWRMQY